MRGTILNHNHLTGDIPLMPELTGDSAEDLTNQASAAATAFYGADVPVHISWAGAATMTRTGAAYKFAATALIHAVQDAPAGTPVREAHDNTGRGWPTDGEPLRRYSL